jgi:hypothetical protein
MLSRTEYSKQDQMMMFTFDINLLIIKTVFILSFALFKQIFCFISHLTIFKEYLY